MTDWAVLRRNMVDSQVRPSAVTDRRIHTAMLEVPREKFVPAGTRALAYCDEEIAVAHDAHGRATRYLIAPTPFARLLQLAGIAPSDHVLDVACATGYSSAVLARLAGSVVAIEDDAGLAERAQETLSETGVDTVAVVQGPLVEGLASQGPYDVIIIEGAVDIVPAALLAQLAPEGRLVAVVGAAPVGRACLFHSGDAVGRPAFDAAIALLPGFARAPAFTF